MERPVSLAVIALAGVALARQLADIASHWDIAAAKLGADYSFLMGVARGWLSTGRLYAPSQYAAPYGPEPLTMLYPPPMLALLVPFSFLPAVLWWAIPLGVIGAVVVRHRPRPAALAVIAVICAWPGTLLYLWYGNPVMWFAAALALATMRGGWAAFIVLKPTLAPFALWGVRRRSWWLTAAGLAVLALVALPLWFDYARALHNFTGGPLYSLTQFPVMLVPVVAWLGRDHAPEREIERVEVRPRTGRVDHVHA